MSSHSQSPATADHPAGAHAPRPPLLPSEAAAGRRRRGWSFPWITLLGFFFLTFNSAMAVHRSRGDRGAVAFAYVDLLALFLCLRRYEAAESGSPPRDRLKVAVWILTTALTLLFSSRVAAVMPVAVAVLVWVMAFATVTGGFYSFFIYSAKQ